MSPRRMQSNALRPIISIAIGFFWDVGFVQILQCVNLHLLLQRSGLQIPYQTESHGGIQYIHIKRNRSIEQNRNATDGQIWFVFCNI